MNISFWTQKWSSLSKMISQNNSFEIHVDVWQKSAQYCQANILQSKNLKNWMAHLTIYCGSVAKSCLTVCDPMDCSTPGFLNDGRLKRKALLLTAKRLPDFYRDTQIQLFLLTDCISLAHSGKCHSVI